MLSARWFYGESQALIIVMMIMGVRARAIFGIKTESRNFNCTFVRICKRFNLLAISLKRFEE